MGRVLMLANAASFILLFNIDNILLLQGMNVRVDVACNFEQGNTCDAETVERFKAWCAAHDVGCHHVAFARNAYRLSENWAAYRAVVEILRREKYDLIHCHTPTGGVIGRLAGSRTGTPVLYTAHGFHFFKGAPPQYWMVYYPIERLLAGKTDCLITINREDYARARKLAGDRAEYIPGIGLDTARFHPDAQRRAEQRGRLGVAEDEILILSVGELIPRKNHALSLRALARLKETPVYGKIRFMLCGIGGDEAKLRRCAKALGISDRVCFAGYRPDIENMYAAADLFLFSSRQEGLPTALLNAMGCGLPIVCTGIRGNTDLVQDGVNGLIADAEEGLARGIRRLIEEPAERKRLGEAAAERARAFSVECVHRKMEAIYRRMLPEG